MTQQQKFLQTLFEPGESTCFTDSPTGIAISAAPKPADLWFSINAIDSTCDKYPTESWHNSTTPRRADHNVISYRNFLIELDSVPLNQQVALVRDRLPVTSIVYSGGKSYHFIISLKEPVKTEAEYRRVIRGLMEAVPEADKSTKNPSRLSRLPGVIRPDTGLLQDLVYLGNRIDLKELPEASPYHEKSEVAAEITFVQSLLLQVLHTGVDNYIAGHFSGRNQFFYWLGKRCSELKHTREQKKAVIDKYYERLENKRGFSIAEAYAAARVKF